MLIACQAIAIEEAGDDEEAQVVVVGRGFGKNSQRLGEVASLTKDGGVASGFIVISQGAWEESSTPFGLIDLAEVPVALAAEDVAR